MSLEPYQRRRSFESTPEPRPGAAAHGFRFCVQRHRARQLHYDFRLEVGGVLKSWAVPHGPTLDHAEKRLAVMVEDHPIEYGDFEGNIPPGNYGAGSVMLWDRGSYEVLGELSAAEQLARGDLKFRLHGQKLAGTWALVRMKGRGKGNEWLLIKKKDEASVPGWDLDQFARSVLTGRSQEEIAADAPPDESGEPMPADVAPMLAFAADSLPTGGGWIFEVKWDGIRAMAYIEGGAVRLRSRRGLALERQFPELASLPAAVAARRAIVDGEIVVMDEAGRPSFSLIQPRIMATDGVSAAHLARKSPAVFFAFDLLYVDGADLRSSPLAERKEALARILRPRDNVRLSEHFDAAAAGGLLEAARQLGLEGVVAKRSRSRYQPRRSRDWLKIKFSRDGEFVICGYTRGERDWFGALVLGVREAGRMRFAGSVGSGFDQKSLEAIHRQLEPLAVAACPFSEEPDLPQPATWVRPELVCTVRFNSWTEEGRLRAPVFVGMRPDVSHDESAPRTAAPPGPALRFRNLDKLYYPADGYTKRDVLDFYNAVAELIVPHLMDRPLSLRRRPDGIGGEEFFQKNIPKGFPSWLRTEEVVSEDGEKRRLAICDTREALLYLANLGCIDQNPWMSRAGSLDNPDFVLVDLDPQECPYARVVEAALLVKQKLDLVGLAGYAKTTGGKGLHVYVPLETVYTYEQSRSFAELLARWVAAERPDLFTLPRAVARRDKGTVYFDYLQNGRGKTIAAPYVLRARPGAPVATPLGWDELTPQLDPARFHIRNAVERFKRVGDLFQGVLTRPQRLEPAIEKLATLLPKNPGQ